MEWMKRAKSIAIPRSRLARMLSHPLKNGTIAAMRSLSRRREISVPTFWGDAFHGVLPESVTALIWRFGIYEKRTTLLVLNQLRPGGVFVDIGAHFGYFTLLTSRIVGPRGKVVAVEAMPATFQQLRRNVEGNGATNVRLVNMAASDEPGELEFKDFGIVNSSLNTCSTVRGVLAGKSAAGMPTKVKAERGDTLLANLDHADIVKIDAESSEEQVLSGLSGFLSERKANIVLVEMGGGDEAEDARALRIVATMRGYGYELHTYQNETFRRVVLSGRVPLKNYLFIPA